MGTGGQHATAIPENSIACSAHRPWSATSRATVALLDQSAVDSPDLTCGGTGADNNVWGEGTLDALAAVTQSPGAPAGTRTGAVTDAATGAPIAGVRVGVRGPFDPSGSTGVDGRYALVVPVSAYTITASVFGYQPQSAAVAVTEGQTIQRNRR